MVASPHPFAALRTVDPRDVALCNDLLRRLPGPGTWDPLHRTVLEAARAFQGCATADATSLAAQVAIHRMGILSTEPDPFLCSPRVRAELRLGGVGVSAWIETTLGAAREVVGRVVRELGAEPDASSEVLTPFEAGVLGFLLGSVVDLVSGGVDRLAPWTPIIVGVPSLQPMDPDPGHVGAEGWVSFLGRVPLAGAITPFRILVPRRVLPSTTAVDRARSRSRMVDRLAGTPVSLGVEVGRTCLRRDDVVLLTAGARVEVDPLPGGTAEATVALAPGIPLLVRQSTRGRASARAHGTLVLDGSRAAVHLERLELDDPQRRLPMSDSDAAVTASAPHEEPEVTLADDVLVELRVELARVTRSLGELATLRSGRTLPLGILPDGRVSLVAGDQVVASGELVIHDGRLAVEITGGVA